MKSQTITTHNYKETQKIAEELGRTLKGGEVLCLYGDLGYGKTTFTQGLAKGLGINHRINSPTFIIMRSYKLHSKDQKSKSKNKKFEMFYHIDLYRINKEQEIVDLGLLDIMNKPENIAIIEWPEKMGRLLPKKRTDIHFEYVDEAKRLIIINT